MIWSIFETARNRSAAEARQRNSGLGFGGSLLRNAPPEVRAEPHQREPDSVVRSGERLRRIVALAGAGPAGARLRVVLAPLFFAFLDVLRVLNVLLVGFLGAFHGRRIPRPPLTHARSYRVGAAGT